MGVNVTFARGDFLQEDTFAPKVIFAQVEKKIYQVYIFFLSLLPLTLTIGR